MCLSNVTPKGLVVMRYSGKKTGEVILFLDQTKTASLTIRAITADLWGTDICLLTPHAIMDGKGYFRKGTTHFGPRDALGYRTQNISIYDTVSD